MERCQRRCLPDRCARRPVRGTNAGIDRIVIIVGVIRFVAKLNVRPIGVDGKSTIVRVINCGNACASICSSKIHRRTSLARVWRFVLHGQCFCFTLSQGRRERETVFRSLEILFTRRRLTSPESNLVHSNSEFRRRCRAHSQFRMALAPPPPVATPTAMRQPFEQQPPAYILQGWRREQANVHDQYLLRQTFLIAPDSAVPCSRLRQRIRNSYDDRMRAVRVVQYDPWAKDFSHAGRAQTASTSNKDLPVHVDFVRSHTTL